MKRTEQIQQILLADGSVVVDSSKKSENLISLAESAARSSSATLTIRDAGTKRTEQLLAIAKAGRGRVIFDFTGKE